MVVIRIERRDALSKAGRVLEEVTYPTGVLRDTSGGRKDRYRQGDGEFKANGGSYRSFHMVNTQFQGA